VQILKIKNSFIFVMRNLKENTPNFQTKLEKRKCGHNWFIGGTIWASNEVVRPQIAGP
jgi:hypothetical protein